MKLRFSIVILILISFLNVGAFSESLANEYSFDELETQCLSKSKFIENGVKVQYKTKTNKGTEEKRIIYYFKELNLKRNSSNNMNFFNETLNVEANVWNDRLYTYVDVTLINTNASYKTLELQNIARKLINRNSEEVQYFCYYKGKIDDNKKVGNAEILEEIMSESILCKADILEVYNGYTGRAILKDNNQINFSISRYNTGTYLIVGTPIIFATY